MTYYGIPPGMLWSDVIGWYYPEMPNSSFVTAPADKIAYHGIKVSWKPLNLRDKNQEDELMLQIFKNGLISNDTYAAYLQKTEEQFMQEYSCESYKNTISDKEKEAIMAESFGTDDARNSDESLSLAYACPSYPQNWELPCPECKGTKEYVGLFKVEKCGKCAGKGTV